MKVRELMLLLATQDPEGEVSLASQSYTPMEHNVAGVVSRGELFTVTGNVWNAKDCINASDVLIAEGLWRRYGHPQTWEVVANPQRRKA
jgi:hypothetical protein